MSTKIAFISGGTGGIGFQVAKRLGQDGYIVILNGIEDAKGAECVAQLYDDGIKAEYYGFDVTDEHADTTAPVNYLSFTFLFLLLFLVLHHLPLPLRSRTYPFPPLSLSPPSLSLPLLVILSPLIPPAN